MKKEQKKVKWTKETLTPQQVEVVRKMIIDSMASVYTDTTPNEAFYKAAGGIADSIIKKSQEALKIYHTVTLPVNFGSMNMAKAKSPAKKAVKKVAKKKK